MFGACPGGGAGARMGIVAGYSPQALWSSLWWSSAWKQRLTSVDGDKLYELCSPNSRSSTPCDDYVLSVADALMLGRVGRWTACIPSGVTDDQAVDVATRFLETHLAKRGSPALGLVAEALAEAFPCK